MDLDAMLILRAFCIVGCAFSLWFLGVSAYRGWREWNDKTKTHWWALFGWVFLGLVAIIENLIQENSPGTKTILQALVVAWTVNALLVKEPLVANPSVPWKKEQDDEREL